jgi:hypothetical protein
LLNLYYYYSLWKYFVVDYSLVVAGLGALVFGLVLVSVAGLAVLVSVAGLAVLALAH